MRLLFTFILVFSLAFPCSAQEWPCTYWFNYTTPEDNLPVAVDSFLTARYPTGMAYPDGGTLIALKWGYTGNSYQIINKYGQFEYDEPQSVWPAIGSYYTNDLKAIPDGGGGAFLAWQNEYTGFETGIYAQRLESLGNICWGDSAVRIYAVPNYDYDVCPDGFGGMWLAISYVPDGSNYADLWLQFINSEGEVALGDSGLVVSSAPHDQRYPKVCLDGEGGVYVVWDDWRPPYTAGGSLFMQRFDAHGNPMWEPEDGLFIFEERWFHQIIPDGENGFILHSNPGAADYNTVYRISPGGEILWSRDHVSWYHWAKIVPGEPGFFYLGFTLGPFFYDYVAMYGQRMDIDGRTYWPTWPGGQLGAEMAYFQNKDTFSETYEDFAFDYPYFYGVVDILYEDEPYENPRELYVQALDLNGHKMYRDQGTLVAIIDTLTYVKFYDLSVVPDGEGGAVAVWQKQKGSVPSIHDVYAMHLNPDGTLGGGETYEGDAAVISENFGYFA